MNIDQTLMLAMDANRAGAFAEAEAHCRAILAIFPEHASATALLGDVLTRAGRRKEALDAYENAIRIQPDNSRLFTGTATMRFRDTFGMPPRPCRPDSGLRRIQMTTLGSNGRFGNQLLQYGFVRLYAQEYGLSAEVPDWIGRDLFDLDDPLPSAKLPAVDEKDADFMASLNRRSEIEYSEIDALGYFCGDTALWGARANAFRALFVPSRKVAPSLDKALLPLRSTGKTLVAIHLRHSDYGYGNFWIAPASWYLDWLNAIWPKLDNPVLYIATEKGKFLAEFARFSPWHAQRLDVALPGAGFLIDYHVLRHADCLAISNSTFSFTAAMLNVRARTFVRPDPERRELIAFDPWAARVLLDAKIETDENSAAERAVIERMFSGSDTVLHIGRYCSPWTNLTRSVHQGLKIHEAESDASIDRWRAENGIRHLRHLVVEEAIRLPEILRGAEKTLRHSRVDMIHFQIAAGRTMPPLADGLGAYGYVLFRTKDGAVGDTIPPPMPLTSGRYVAVQERFLKAASAQIPGSLDLPALCRKHGIAVRGVVNVGAHEGREIALYDAMRVERVVFVEANPAVYSRLSAAMRQRSNVTTVRRAIADRAGKAQLHLASFDQSSSLLPMARYFEIYPQIEQAGTIDVDVTRLDDLMTEFALPSDRFNVLSIDVQGAEAMALRGATETLRHADAIKIAVYFSDLYKGAAEVEEIDEMLSGAGFRRVATVSPSHQDWGHAFYVRGG